MADRGGKGGGGEGAVVVGHGGGDEGQQQEVGGDEVRHTPVGEEPATEEVGAVGPNVEPNGSSTVAEGLPVVGRSSGDVGVVTLSSYGPITNHDVAEYLSDEALAKLIEDNPSIGLIVLKAKEDWATEIAASVATERAERERKEREEPLRNMEAEEWADAKAVVPKERARQRDIRGFGGASRSLELYENLPLRVRQLVDEVGFGEFIWTLSPVKNDHAVLVAFAERWRDTTNTFHLPPGEKIVTPADFTAITGLRVGGEPNPSDSGIHNDRAALKWFLGKVPKIEEGMVRYDQFTRYLQKEVAMELEAKQMARAYLLHLFGTSLYPSRCSKYLPALRDLKIASGVNWGGAALGATYGFLGDSSKTE
ncbi:hypothetical protein RHMOL_Rhmol11G0051600 [Rhododendron molle]|uniref:Uncharacterized protein n=1 Tax=Rhododendron molle TaxID=49168 RepID=A0ACC0LNJ2_RHOML|nr:hypothetical protein RHMOL_Rhmol11G0051600 [Rhododendron molle]